MAGGTRVRSVEASCALGSLPGPLETMEQQSEGRGSEGSQGASAVRVQGLWMRLLKARLNQGGRPSKGLPGRALTQSEAGNGP